MGIVEVVVEGLNGSFRTEMAELVQSCRPIQIELRSWCGSWMGAKTVGWAAAVLVIQDRKFAIVRVFWR